MDLFQRTFGANIGPQRGKAGPLVLFEALVGPFGGAVEVHNKQKVAPVESKPKSDSNSNSESAKFRCRIRATKMIRLKNQTTREGLFNKNTGQKK